jgi:hypothetical protein
MRRPLQLALGAALLSSLAAPAFAAWDHIGSVDFGFRNDRGTEYGNFGGSVEALMFEARDSDVMCNNVTATFGNGRTRDVFHGYLRRGREMSIDLPGADRFVRRLDFNCHAMSRGGGRVDIAADIGRYRAEWRRSPDWDRVWSRMFDWGRPVAVDRYASRPLDAGDWITIGSERFEGRLDREASFAGWRGRRVDTIGLRPLNDDARCRSVTATFDNGRTRTLPIDNGDMLFQDRVFTVDLPGNERNIARLDMNCHAEHGRAVTIQVLASR